MKFLFSVFWDLYCAAPERRDSCEHSSEAKAFHDYVIILMTIILFCDLHKIIDCLIYKAILILINNKYTSIYYILFMAHVLLSGIRE